MEMILGELFSLVRNGANIKQYDDASGFPITRIQTISSGFVDRSKVGYANIDDATRYSSYILQDGDILMSHINSLDHLGKAALYQHAEGETLIHGMNLLVLRADTSSLIPKYALRLFQSNKFKASLRKIAKKSVNQASFSVSDLKRLRINVPSLDSQTYVANLFDTIDCIITRAQKLTELLDRLVKSRFIEMFGDVRENPHGYKKACLKDVAIGRLTYGANCSAVDYDGRTRYLRITDITDAGGLNDDVKSPSVINEKYTLADGDLLFARSGATVGKTHRYRQADGRAMYAGYLIRLVPNQAIVLPDYLFWYTRTDFYKSFIEHAQRTVAQPNINAQQFGLLEILLPPLDNQRSFVAFANRVDKLRFDVQRQVEKLETLKKSLMQEYFG